MLSSNFYDVRLKVKTTVKENMLQNFCFQECRLAQEWIRLVHHGNYCIYTVFVDGFVFHFALLQLFSNHLVLSFSKYRGRIDDGSHLESLDALGPGRRIYKKCALAR